MASTEKSHRLPTWNVLGSTAEFINKAFEGAEGARKRVYTDRDGVEHTKYEFTADRIRGKITSMDVYDGDFGRTISIVLDNELRVSLGISQNNDSFATSFLQALPNINLDEEVVLSPFKTKKGNSVMGVYQGVDEEGKPKAVENYYVKWDDDTKKFVDQEKGLPQPKEGDKSKSYWTEDYFPEVRKFLISELEKHSLFKKEVTPVQPEVTEQPAEKPKDNPF